jgi:hypothetical protein
LQLLSRFVSIDSAMGCGQTREASFGLRTSKREETEVKAFCGREQSGSP